MTDKERLIEILSKTIYPKEGVDPAEVVADYLLDNGVIVPPCKVGDTVFAIPSEVNCKLNIMHNMHHNNRIYEQVVDHITIWQSDYMLYTCDGLCAVRSKAYKDTWFTTREEAEKALAERVQK